MPYDRVLISRDEVMLGRLGTIVNDYSLIRLKAGGPKNAAIYTRQGINGDVTVYFSDGASELAPQLLFEWKAEGCRRPTGVSMMVGDQSDQLAL